jgi:hypothetical protein
VYIEATSGAGQKPKVKLPALPLVSMLTSMSFWAIQIAAIGFAWIGYSMMVLTPLYLANIQNVSDDIVSKNVFYLRLCDNR